jgi:glycosyltransferase involved in cell wall biosynthesis
MAEAGGHTGGCPSVSVVMNCLNGEKYLREAIDSVYAQTFKDWEIIFWDNASTDGSAGIARSYGERLRYFRSEKTFLLGKARNLAFAEATGAHIAILDCDDIWLPDKLEKQLGLFSRNPSLGFTFSNSLFFNGGGDESPMFSAVTPHRGFAFRELFLKNFISTETMIFRRSALESLDRLFNEDFTMVMDYDLTLRLSWRYAIDYVEEPLSKWRMHPGSESNRKRFLIPHETLNMLEKLIRDIPEMGSRYGHEIEIFRKGLDYEFALEEWSQGNRGGAREHLLPHARDPKFLLTLLLTFALSYRNYEQMKPFLRAACRIGGSGRR